MGNALPKLSSLSSKSSNLSSTINQNIIFPGARQTQIDLFQFQQGIKVSEHSFSKKSIQIVSKMVFGPINSDQQVDFLKISSEQSQQKPAKIVFFHGNAQNMLESLQLIMPVFKQLQITTYVMEYPGYGSYRRTEGSIPDRIRSDCEQFHELIKKQSKVEDEEIYIVGRSIGTGVASYLASKVKCRKLLLFSPFDSIKSIANKMIGVKLLGSYAPLDNFLLEGQFDNLQSISKFKGKLMIIHGEKDKVINISHGENLHQKYIQTQQNEQNCLDSKFERLPQRGHNDIDMNFGDEYLLKKIEDFFTQNEAKL